MVTDLLGMWVQDNYAASSRKTYVFSDDGTFSLKVTTGGQVVQTEDGTFAAEGSTLTLTPAAGARRSTQWKVDEDPYVGDTRLVLGAGDIYYRS